MTFIKANIQDGYLKRKGWRGRFLTLYWHKYGVKQESTGRYHSHPWLFAISIVIDGQLKDDIENVGSRWRRSFNVSIYTPFVRHRILDFVPNTRTLFIGLFRTQYSISSAGVRCKEGYCHYSETSGDIEPPP